MSTNQPWAPPPAPDAPVAEQPSSTLRRGTGTVETNATLHHMSLGARAGVVAAIVAAVVVTVFAAQNTQGVQVNWLAWTTRSTPLFVVVLAAIALGLVIGWLTASLRWRRRTRRPAV